MKKAILVGIAISFAIAILVVIGLRLRFKYSNQQRFYGKPRKQWKELAIAAVARRGADTVWLTNEVGKIKAALASDGQAWWSSQTFLVMQNGEWMLCTNVCNKEDSRVHDLFIGRGSDGQWYYSDYHFCIGMIALDVLGMGPPASLQDFAQACSLRNFDGRSDECLKPAWDHKLRMTHPLETK